jgi:hypothetical protein
LANELKQVYGSSTTVISLAATLANAANTYSGLTGCTLTQLDNSTLLYPYALAVLNINDTFAAAPTSGATVDLYMHQDDIDGTADETPEPAATDITARGTCVGSFVVDNVDAAHVKPLVISLLGVKKARFAILNNSGQTISYTSVATVVKVTPFSLVPT